MESGTNTVVEWPVVIAVVFRTEGMNFGEVRVKVVMADAVIGSSGTTAWNLHVFQK